MKRKAVSSTSIRSIGYDHIKQHLEVQFNRGAVWLYTNVTPEEYESLLSAPHIGSHFHYWKKEFRRPGVPVLEFPKSDEKQTLIQQLKQSKRKVMKG